MHLFKKTPALGLLPLGTVCLLQWALVSANGVVTGGLPVVAARSVLNSNSLSSDTTTDTATASGTSTSVTAASSSISGPSSTSNSTSGPRFVIYSDRDVVNNVLPDVSDIEGYTTFVLGFLLSTGPIDQAKAWAGLDNSTRQQRKKTLTDAGISLLISVFGSTEHPTSKGLDATSTARTIAQWVIDFDLDGIDVDYEDEDAILKGDGSAEEWVATFTKTLRETLPQGQYILTHAPGAPLFSTKIYTSGAYMTINKDVGDVIDWYNVQYYGIDDYDTCDTLVKASTKTPGTALEEIISAGVPQDKLVVGKAATSTLADGGYMDASTISACLEQAKNDGWTGGAMVWEYPDADSSWIKSVRSQSWPQGS